MKRKLAILMIIAIIFSILPHNYSSATIIIPDDTENYYYVGNNIDLDSFTIDNVLSVENYNLYFDTLSGTDKTNITNKFVLYTSNNYGQRLVNDIVYNDYVVNNGNTINSCYFSSIQIDGQTIPIDDCYKMINLMGNYNQMDRTVLFSLFYSPTGDEIVVSGDGVYSSAPFYYSFQNFTFDYVTDNDINHFEYYIAGGNHGVQANFNSTDNVYQYVFNNDFQGVVYCDMVYLFTSTSFADINTNIKSYKAYIENTSSLAVDRRTQKFIDITDDGDNVRPSDYGFKEGSFHNLIYGGLFDSQKLMVVYELNDASKTISNDLYLKFNYEFIFNGEILNTELSFDGNYYNTTGKYDLYSLNNTSYVNVDLSKIFDYTQDIRIDTSNDYHQILSDIAWFQSIGNINKNMPTYFNDKYASVNNIFDTLIANNILTGVPTNIQRNDSIINDLSVTIPETTVSIKLNLDAITNSYLANYNYENRVDDIKIIVTESVYNMKTGEESSIYMYQYNYLDGSIADIGSLEKEGEVFNGKYTGGAQSLTSYSAKDINFDMASGQYLPSSNAYGGSSNSSVGDINISVGTNAAVEIVDISSEEWLQHSPNFNELITTVKTGLTSVAEGSQSVATLLATQYAVFPVAVWGYLGLAVAIIASLSVVRYIRRG